MELTSSLITSRKNNILGLKNFLKNYSEPGRKKGMLWQMLFRMLFKNAQMQITVIYGIISYIARISIIRWM